MRVTVVPTCLGETFFAEATTDTVRLLRWLGAHVEVPGGATCCGQPAHNAGHVDAARAMGDHMVGVLHASEHIVLPSGSCAAMLRCHLPSVASPGVRTRAEGVARRSWDLAGFLVEVMGSPDLGRGLSNRRLAYHHGCHALRELGVRREPVALLEAAGATVEAWEADRECCGFGGLFSVKMPAVSGAMADRKLDTLPPDVDTLVSNDPGCLLHLDGRARRRGVPPPVRHLASLLWEATGER